jgi:hypothetical protein
MKVNNLYDEDESFMIGISVSDFKSFKSESAVPHRLASIKCLAISFLFLVGGFSLAHSAVAAESTLAYPGNAGRMLYDSRAIGDRIPDFSSVGYRFGEEALPNVPGAVFVSPQPGDDTASIQAAINAVSALPINADGFRGAVVLAPGEFEIATSLNIFASGVVLRGAGDGVNGTVLRATSTTQSTTIRVLTGSSKSKISSSERTIADKYVPVGATSFRVNDPSNFSVGDDVIVHRPSTAAWISAMGMDMIPPRADGGTVVQWAPGSKDLLSDRHITRIEGDRVFIDAPLTNSLDAQFGGGTIYNYNFANRLENIGIEGIRGVSDYDTSNPFDEAHAWTFISIDDTEHAWVRDVTSQHYGRNTVSVEREGKNITVVDAHSVDPISIVTGSRRYAFEIDGQLNIVRDSTSDKGRHDFVFNSPSPGPNVFYNSVATNALDETGPHQRYSTGGLFDNVTVDGDQINLRNRGNFGTGHGWAGANMVIWNSNAESYIIQNPPTAQNWMIGSVGAIQTDTRFGVQEDGIVDQHGAHVDTQSLYLAQLADRTSLSGSQMREYVVGDYDLFQQDGAGSVDAPFVSANLLNEFNSILSSGAANQIGFDDTTNPGLVPFTWDYQLDQGEQVYHAVMSMAVRKSGGQTSNDILWYDSIANQLSFSGDLGLVSELSTVDSQILTLEFTGSDLALFQDGEFNILVGDSVAVDWARLELLVADVALTGDFNFDGTLNAADIDSLCGAFNGTDLFYDLDGDGQVGSGDLNQLVTNEIGTLMGDANLDGFVNGADYVLWNSHKFESGHGWADGDFNCDSTVDGADFIVWNTFKFQAADLQSVPEPPGMMAVGILLGLCFCRRFGCRA